MLEYLLRELAARGEEARVRYIAQRRKEAEDEDYDPESDFDGGFWLTLKEAPMEWECGWQIRPNEATEWAIVATGATPTAAAQALLKLVE